MARYLERKKKENVKVDASICRCSILFRGMRGKLFKLGGLWGTRDWSVLGYVYLTSIKESLIELCMG